MASLDAGVNDVDLYLHMLCRKIILKLMSLVFKKWTSTCRATAIAQKHWSCTIEWTITAKLKTCFSIKINICKQFTDSLPMIFAMLHSFKQYRSFRYAARSMIPIQQSKMKELILMRLGCEKAAFADHKLHLNTRKWV